jgi:alpha-amylase
VFNHLIAADNLLDNAIEKTDAYVEAAADDYNFDGWQEVRLANDKLITMLAPAVGGQMYELDVRPICHNLLATLTRRPEAYHRKVLAGPAKEDDHCASIHDRVVFKQEGLDQQLQYDKHPRKSLIDHFYDKEVTLEAVRRGEAMERGDFASGLYDARLRRNPGRIQTQLTRRGNAWGIPLKITKGVTAEAGGSTLEIAYLIEGIPKGTELHFAVEFNFSGLPSGVDDRYFYGAEREQIGDLGTMLDLKGVRNVGMVDEWLGIDVHLSANRPTGFWTFPVETVSQSEGGVELVQQSVVVQPHWLIRGDADGRWVVTIELTLDTSLAEKRKELVEQAAMS